MASLSLTNEVSDPVALASAVAHHVFFSINFTIAIFNVKIY